MTLFDFVIVLVIHCLRVFTNIAMECAIQHEFVVRYVCFFYRIQSTNLKFQLLMLKRESLSIKWSRVYVGVWVWWDFRLRFPHHSDKPNLIYGRKSIILTHIHMFSFNIFPFALCFFFSQLSRLKSILNNSCHSHTHFLLSLSPSVQLYHNGVVFAIHQFLSIVLTGCMLTATEYYTNESCHCRKKHSFGIYAIRIRYIPFIQSLFCHACTSKNYWLFKVQGSTKKDTNFALISKKKQKKVSQQENVDMCMCVDENEKKWHGNVEWIVYNEIETLE